jgi:hypothetical protein
MKKSAVLWGMILLLAGALGCSTDRRRDKLSQIEDQVSQAALVTKSIKSELDKAIASAEKDKKGKKIKKEDLAKVFKEMKKLGPVGTKLLSLRADADNLKAKMKDEEREDLAREFGPRLAARFKELEKANTSLDASLDKAAQLTDEATARELRTELRNAKQEFVSLTRRH